MKVLILGSNGSVGSSLVRIMSKNKAFEEVIASKGDLRSF